MSFLKSIKAGLFLVSLAYASIGILLLVDVYNNIVLVFNVLAVFLMVAGLMSIFSYFFLQIEERFKRNDFVVGMILILLGVVLFCGKNRLVDFSSFIFGICIAISGIFNFQDALDAQKMNVNNVGLFVIIGILTLGLGILVLVNPFYDPFSLFIVIGISLIICGFGGLFANIYLASQIVQYDRRLSELAKQPIVEVVPEPVVVEPIKEEEPVIDYDGHNSFANIQADKEKAEPIEEETASGEISE